jgi:hypothetical protein
VALRLIKEQYAQRHVIKQIFFNKGRPSIMNTPGEVQAVILVNVSVILLEIV